MKISEQILIDEATLRQRVSEMAAEIAADTPAGRPLSVLAVMDGAVLFCADLVRRLPAPVHLGFVRVASVDRGGDPACGSRSYLTSRPGDLKRLMLISPASRSRTAGSSATGWTGRGCTAICPISPLWTTVEAITARISENNEMATGRVVLYIEEGTPRAHEPEPSIRLAMTGEDFSS